MASQTISIVKFNDGRGKYGTDEDDFKTAQEIQEILRRRKSCGSNTRG